MASFTVRVLLHDGEWDDYENLHELMEQDGFTRTITDSKGIVYRLPQAECNLIGEYDRKTVLKMAKVNADLTGRGDSVLVTESKGRTWADIDVVETADN